MEFLVSRTINSALQAYASSPPIVQAFALIAIAVVVVVIVASMRWLRVILWRALLIPAASFLGLAAALAFFFWGIASRITQVVVRIVPIDKLLAQTFAFGAGLSRSPLVKGDREVVARAMWPAERYPELYETVPDDIVRPPYEDGRLVGGYRIAWLQDRHFTDDALRSAIRAGVTTGLMIVFSAAILQIIGGLIAIALSLPGLIVGRDAVLVESGWTGIEPDRLGGVELFLARALDSVVNIGAQLVSLVAVLPGFSVLGLGAVFLITVLLMRAWMRLKGAQYERATKDADVRWPFRAETRELLRQAYRRQIEFAKKLVDLPTFFVGKATGTLRARGDMAAPLPGVEMRIDADALCQHVMVFGGTGEGKTSRVVEPLLEQALGDRRLGLFVADAKGALWPSVKRMAQRVGRAADVHVIGVAEGQVSVDLSSSLAPAQVSAVLRSVMSQIGGPASDAMVADLAANTVRHALTIGQSYAPLQGGVSDARVHAGQWGVVPKPGSIWWAYQAILAPGMIEDAIEAIEDDAREFQDKVAKAASDEAVRAIASGRDPAVVANVAESVDFFRTIWPASPPSVRAAVSVYLAKMMDGFTSEMELTRRFLNGAPVDRSGRSLPSVSIEDVFDGKIALVALSSVENGTPARVVTQLLKTALYRAARARMAAASTQPLRPDCLVVLDDAHELVTVDPSSGLSDATFWNVARAAGLAGLFATQSVAALEQSMGEPAAQSFIETARSKIFLRSEERRTVEYACWCAGAFERNRVFLDGQRESLEQRWLLDGFDPIGQLDEDLEVEGGWRALFTAAQALVVPDLAAAGSGTRGQAGMVRDAREVEQARLAGEMGERLSLAGSSGGGEAGQGATGRLGLQGRFGNDAVLRASGNDILPAVQTSDLLHMGRWHAFAHLQRAGAVRQDIVSLEVRS